MDWKIPLRVIGIILLMVALLELLNGGVFSAFVNCGLGLGCYLPDKLPSLQTAIILTVLGVSSILAATSIGRRPGD